MTSELEIEIERHVSEFGPLKEVSKEEVKQAVAERRDEIISAFEKEKVDIGDYSVLILKHSLYKKLGGEYSRTHYFIGGHLVLNAPLWKAICEEINNL